MSTNLKQHEVLTAIPETTSAYPVTSATASSADGGARRQPVALEIPVTVNGARTVAGSDKREPFSESTKTVLVFGHGAVVRLSSSVAPGQLIFLTNDKTQKEVVCEVVDSKNHHHTSGYVELEFTEAVAGFWGMRFAPERGTSQQHSAPSAPSPAAHSPAASPLTSAASSSPASPSISSPNLPAPSAAKIPVASATTELKPVAPIVAASAQTSASNTPQTTAVFHKNSLSSASELSEFLTGERKAARPAESAGAATEKSATEKSTTAAQASKTQTAAAVEAPVPSKVSTKVSPSSASSSSLDFEEVKIPAWLEPLARNAAPASATLPNYVPAEEEATEDEQSFEGPEIPVTEIAAVPERKVVELTAPSFGMSMLADENDLSTPATSNRSNKQILIIAVAAAVLMFVTVVVWYANQSNSSSQTSVATASHSATESKNVAGTPSASTSATPANSNASGNYTAVSSPVSASGTASGTPANTSAANTASSPGRSSTNVSGNTLASSGASSRANSAGNSPDITNADYNVEKNATVPDAAPKSAPPRVKKSAVVRPSVPAVIRNTSGGTRPDEEMILSATNQPAAATSLESGLLVSNSSKPAVPPPASAPRIGGVVRAARLVTSVPPVYPPVAKSQRVAGDVKIDALVDANGQVASMKAVSGNPLLQQAAMDAVRHWKYEPAQLGGKPVPMHLTVTVQFHLQ